MPTPKPVNEQLRPVYKAPPGLNRVTTQDPEDHAYPALLNVQGHIPTSFPERGWSTYYILQS